MSDGYEIQCPDCGTVITTMPIEPSAGLWTCASCDIGFTKSGDVVAESQLIGGNKDA